MPPSTLEKGRDHPAAASPPWIRSGREDLGGEIPQPTVEPDILPDRGDAPGPRQPATRRPPAEATHEQVLLDAVEDAPEVVAGVLDPPAGQQLRRLHAALLGLWIAHGERPLGEPDLLDRLPLGGAALGGERRIKPPAAGEAQQPGRREQKRLRQEQPDHDSRITFAHEKRRSIF